MGWCFGWWRELAMGRWWPWQGVCRAPGWRVRWRKFLRRGIFPWRGIQRSRGTLGWYPTTPFRSGKRKMDPWTFKSVNWKLKSDSSEWKITTYTCRVLGTRLVSNNLANNGLFKLEYNVDNINNQWECAYAPVIEKGKNGMNEIRFWEELGDCLKTW